MKENRNLLPEAKDSLKVFSMAALELNAEKLLHIYHPK